MSQKDKMHTTELYLPTDEEIMQEQTECMEKLYDYNATRPKEWDKRCELLRELFAEIGEGCLYIHNPILFAHLHSLFFWELIIFYGF